MASVKAFLVEAPKVNEGRLSVIGFGEEQLKNKDDPLADENRRVQIVNTGSATVAEGKPAEAAPVPEAAPKQEAARQRPRRRKRQSRSKGTAPPPSELTHSALQRWGSAA